MKTIFSTFILVAASIAAMAHGAELTFNFNTLINGNALQYNTNYVVNGTTIQAQYLGYYVTNIRLVKSDNTEEAFPNVVLVKNNANNALTLEIDNGTYTSVKFDIGIADQAINLGDPSVYPSTNPLSLQTPSHHWSWQSGYIFFRLDGKVDTSANQTGGGAVKDLVVHLGLAPQVRTVTKTININANGTHTNPALYNLNVTFNVEDFFTGVNLKTDNYTMSFDVPALATTTADNLQNAFEVAAEVVSGIADKNIFTNNVQVFPNPANNQVMVSINEPSLLNGSLLVTDITGKTVVTQNIVSNNQPLNLSNLPTGLYFIRHSNFNVKGLKIQVQ